MQHHLKDIQIKSVPDIQLLKGHHRNCRCVLYVPYRWRLSKLTRCLRIVSLGDPSGSALPDGPAGPDRPSVPGQEAAPGGDGGSVGPERGPGEKVSGLQEGAG